MKRAVDWHFREDTYRSKTTFTSGDKTEVTITDMFEVNIFAHLQLHY